MLRNTVPYRKKVADKTAKIGVFGICRSSLDYAVENAVIGFHCTCIDSDRTLVYAINNAINPFRCDWDKELARMVKEGRISGTDDFNVIGNLDMVVIGRSSSRNTSAIRFLRTAAKDILGRVKPGCIVLLDSSVYTWDDVSSIKSVLESSGMRENQDFCVGMTLDKQKNLQRHRFNDNSIIQ